MQRFLKAAQVGLIFTLIIGPSIASIPKQGGWTRYCDKCMGETSNPITVDSINKDLYKSKQVAVSNEQGILVQTNEIQTRKCKEFQAGMSHSNCVKDVKMQKFWCKKCGKNKWVCSLGCHEHGRPGPCDDLP
ncbi:hypothetical protein PGT21_023780 [Puccinia graminis f. sp. tritici]|uniref:Uncharacterized protein n=1 Tax=Puccinia graminis f. sp. tritici TaxID=56615 RepID=A0A5B0M3G7_PUCGR|nr:hypothetical protein PGT21_023780 [Puccinia graminis f. sp. tritici]KAA1085125.1 hypothetical protein PGTUg99_007646 [Puccinia graminis f. sp. tritici]KAA1125713.1 hypothetical protein PGTUg99_004677 [Puccinia graminis f. sp. tritici]